MGEAQITALEAYVERFRDHDVSGVLPRVYVASRGFGAKHGAWRGAAMGKGFGSILSLATAMACGAADSARFPDGATWHVRISRSDSHPTYSCEGTVDTAARDAQFFCVAERFGSWTVNGPVEQFRSAVLLQLWIRTAASKDAVQPDIAVDLEAVGDRLRGWATIVLPDGTGNGHPGAIAEAWL